MIACAAISMTVALDARTIRDFFVSEPDNIFIMLDANSRRDMLDYFDAGKLVATDNGLGGASQLLKVTDKYMSVRISKSSVVEMEMNCSGKDTTIAVISTVQLPALDSRINFYDTGWNRLETKKYIKLPAMGDFALKIAGSEKSDDVIENIKFPIISYAFEPSTGNLIARQNIKDFMSKDDYAKIASSLKDTITYTLKGVKFKLKK
jgi:hypothetical protein